MTPPTHIIHIGFFEEGTEERVGAVDHAVPPRVGEVVWLGTRPWEVIAVQWSYTHPDSPAARDGQMGGIVDVMVRPGRGLFR